MKKNSQPATFGGAGFQYRQPQWQHDLGSLWKNWTVSCDGDPLQKVVLAMPADVYRDIPDIDTALMLDIPDIEKMRDQCQTIAEIYEKNGVTVHLCEHRLATPNWIFQRDLYNSSPNGIILGRPASQERRGEEAIMLELLAQKCAPIIYSMHRDAFFEGADLLWISEKKALLGLGNRSNLAAYEQLCRLYPDTTFHRIQLPAHIQHLLGLVNFIEPDTVGIWSSQCSPHNRTIIQQAGLQIIDITEEQEIRERRSFNWVCLGPKTLLLPEDAPKTIAFLRKKGIHVITTKIDSYRKCGGGLGCLTGILHRKQTDSQKHTNGQKATQLL